MKEQENPFIKWAITMERVGEIIPSLERIESLLNKLSLEPGEKPLIPKLKVMEMLNVTPPTLDVWHKKNILRKTWIGRKVFYSQQELDRYINQGKNGGG